MKHLASAWLLLSAFYIRDIVCFEPASFAIRSSICQRHVSIPSTYKHTQTLARSFHSHLFEATNIASKEVIPTSRSSIDQVVRGYYRATWLSWWVQIILSVISGVTLLFARQQSRGLSIWVSGYAFNVISVFIAYANVLWTWNCALLCNRLQRDKPSDTTVLQNLQRYARIAITISLVGMVLNIISAEQIVGNLASKILSAQPQIFSTGGMAAVNTNNVFQALDIFLVQANTNTLVSHFAPLVCYLWQMQFSITSNRKDGV